MRASHTFLSKLLREEFCYILKSSLLIFPARKALQRHENLRLQAGSFCIENTVALCMDKAIVDSDLKKRLGFFFYMPIFLGFTETSELCVDKQLNQLSFTF